MVIKQARHTVQARGLIIQDVRLLSDAYSIALTNARELGMRVDIYRHTSTRSFIVATATPTGDLDLAF